MTPVAFLVRLLAGGFEWLAGGFNRLADFFNGLLPALLSPSQLTRLVQHQYLTTYGDEFLTQTVPALEPHLDAGETDLMDRYHIHAGRMLVMGAGWGREALALARRGLTVVGMDTNHAALRLAVQMAESATANARFHQADFLAPPYAPASFDFALLSSIMYSAIPGRSQRQAWLKDFGLLLKPDGLLFLSFLPLHQPASRLKALGAALTALLAKLPGANPDFQTGDGCSGRHFLHAFQNEEELRSELDGAGVVLRELNWSRGFAVISYKPQAVQGCRKHPHIMSN